MTSHLNETERFSTTRARAYVTENGEAFACGSPATAGIFTVCGLWRPENLQYSLSLSLKLTQRNTNLHMGKFYTRCKQMHTQRFVEGREKSEHEIRRNWPNWIWVPISCFVPLWVASNLRVCPFGTIWTLTFWRMLEYAKANNCWRVSIGVVTSWRKWDSIKRKMHISVLSVKWFCWTLDRTNSPIALINMVMVILYWTWKWSFRQW